MLLHLHTIYLFVLYLFQTEYTRSGAQSSGEAIWHIWHPITFFCCLPLFLGQNLFLHRGLCFCPQMILQNPVF